MSVASLTKFEDFSKKVIGKQPLVDLPDLSTLQAGDWLVNGNYSMVQVLNPESLSVEVYRDQYSKEKQLYYPSPLRMPVSKFIASRKSTFDIHKNVPQPSTWKLLRGSTFPQKALIKLGISGLLSTHGYTIGSDPELFAFQKTGELIPAWEFLPKKAGSQPIYWDGYQAELRTSYGTCCDGQYGFLWGHLHKMHLDLQAKFPGAKLQAVDCVGVSPESLAKAKDEHVEFGCKPSKNAYGHAGITVEQPREFPWRFAGGHLHLGTQFNPKGGGIVEAVKALDAILGVMCVSLFPDDNPRRRQYYGLAGEYRQPAHGLEYRALSNGWLRAPQLFYLVMGTARIAAGLGQSRMLSQVWTGSEAEVVECINNCDIAAAKKMIRRNAHLYAGIVTKIVGPTIDKNAKKTLKILLNGHQVAFKEPLDLVGNWQLDQGAGMVNSGRWYDFIGKVKL